MPISRVSEVHSTISAGAGIVWSLSTRMGSSSATEDSGKGGSGSSGGLVVIATTSTGVSAAIAAGSADPLVLGWGCRLSWPNSASDGMVNRPIPQGVAVVTQFSSLASCRGGGTIGTHLAWVSLNLCRTGSCQGSTVGQAVAINAVW